MTHNRLPSIDDFANAEHCVLEDVTVQHPALNEDVVLGTGEAREIRDETEIRDKLRGRSTRVRIYREGWVDVEVERRRGQASHHRFDLRFLDPVPSIERRYPNRILKGTGIVAGLTGLISIPAFVGWFTGVMIPAAIVGGGMTASGLFVAFYLSHEKIRFKTLHGRADAIRFGAGLGTIRRFRKLVPMLVEAIADTTDTVTDDTAGYLRAEMREHYRLKSDGVLSEAECAESTGRILGEFDGPL